MNEYLEPGDVDVYLDHPTPEDRLAQWRKYHPTLAPLVCPKCNGYGGHNLKVNEYRLPAGMANTPENRHRYCHFLAGCMQCSSWGFVSDQRDAACAHDFDHGTVVGNCLRNYTCKKCGRVIQIDSSD